MVFSDEMSLTETSETRELCRIVKKDRGRKTRVRNQAWKIEEKKKESNKLGKKKKARRERWRIRHGAPTDTFSDGLNILIAKLRNAYYSAD